MLDNRSMKSKFSNLNTRHLLVEGGTASYSTGLRGRTESLCTTTVSSLDGQIQNCLFSGLQLGIFFGFIRLMLTVVWSLSTISRTSARKNPSTKFTARWSPKHGGHGPCRDDNFWSTSLPPRLSSLPWVLSPRSGAGACEQWTSDLWDTPVPSVLSGPEEGSSGHEKVILSNTVRLLFLSVT